jgi:hypothetical protein
VDLCLLFTFIPYRTVGNQISTIKSHSILCLYFMQTCLVIAENDRYFNSKVHSDAGSPCKCTCFVVIVFTSEDHFIGNAIQLYISRLYLVGVDHVNSNYPSDTNRLTLMMANLLYFE